jgi:glycosyltransferase involved in cell wall biosynthesis
MQEARRMTERSHGRAPSAEVAPLRASTLWPARARVLHVIPSVSASSGGPSKAIVQMERVLADSGVQVVTVTTDDDGPDRRLVVATGEEIAAGGVTRLYFPRQIRPYKASLPMLRWLRQQVPRFDLVHVHALFSFAPVAGAWIARQAGVPYVIRPLGVLNRYGMVHRRSSLKLLSLRLLEGRLLRDAAAVHFTSEQERIEAEMLGITMRSHIVPLGVEPVATASAALFLDAHPGLGRRRLLYLSRVDPKKNIEALLQAVALVKRTIPDLSLILCGDGDNGYMGRLKSLSTELGLENCVRWAGHVDGAMKASAFAAAEVFVLPSYSENFGIAAVEALSAGLPCILGHGVAVSTRVAEAGAGLAVAPTVDAVASAITEMLADPTRLALAAQRARALAAAEYTVEAMGRGLLAMYAEAYETHGKSRR